MAEDPLETIAGEYERRAQALRLKRPALPEEPAPRGPSPAPGPDGEARRLRELIAGLDREIGAQARPRAPGFFGRFIAALRRLKAGG